MNGIYKYMPHLIWHLFINSWLSIIVPYHYYHAKHTTIDILYEKFSTLLLLLLLFSYVHSLFSFLINVLFSYFIL